MDSGNQLLFPSLLGAGVLLWFSLVANEVEGPYLDEYFHIRQALEYLNNRFEVWDDKITTPPGLYFLSYPWLQLLRLANISGSVETHLRSLNAVAILFLWYTVYDLIKAVQAQLKKEEDATTGSAKVIPQPGHEFKLAHVALNISLFPLLFFFSGLYYTDIVSALVVLKAHSAFYAHRPLWLTFWSLASLTLRQTNVFWTAIYLAAFEVKRNLDIQSEVAKVEPPKKTAPGEIDEGKDFDQVLNDSWVLGQLYDRRFELAAQEDYLKTGVSFVVAAVSNFQLIFIPMIPYITVLVSFASFVFMNGGVVLGDKSNHVASLHVPQMLYIWPYIVFFSLPVILGSLYSRAQRNTLMKPLPDALIALLCAALFWIAMNTIVHPFILADNRHYTFYVFRILLRHPVIRFLAAPIYIVCGWASLSVFGSRTSTALIWISVTTLSVVTAPLVEPRYFILPWVLWRVHVGYPLGRTESLKPKDGAASPRSSSQLGDLLVRHALWLETAWLLAINIVTGYIFLKWKFEWPQEPGAVMRFMW